ncbi:MAG: hypothetical protein HYW02_01060 [Deltaproteobacteria bacterium]|nr:hypothetical protein [Deltaproteobacteria bacterium]MBI2500070.1 hypothetical protein [Deltaproteobacteria bacterium]
MDFRVIVTLGPAIQHESTLKEIHAVGPCIFRINGAHSSGAAVLQQVKFVRGILPTASLMVDLPGNKIRTECLKQPISLVKGKTIRLNPADLNFKEFYRYVKVGDKVYANDSVYTLEIHSIEGETLYLLSHSDGELTNNKGLHVQGIHHQIPFIFEKDMELLEAGSQCAIDYISLSFVRTAEDIREVKRLLARMGNQSSRLIAKVETLSAVKNLGHILREVDEINVDRGDLSTDVGLFELASYQERIIEAAKRAGKKVFLATQFLKNMEKWPIPLIAEIIDLHKTVKSGIHGIQLSEETAIGKYPVECVRNVFKVYYNSFSS